MPIILPSIIAVHGKKRSGKGTVANYLVQQHGYKVVKFADPLKDMLRVLLKYCGLDEVTIEECIEGDPRDLKEVPLDMLGGKSTRYAMQVLGTEWRNMIDADLWINIAARRIQTHLAAGDRVVIDDLRFPNEKIRLATMFAEFWLVTNSRTANGGVTGSHASEQGLPPEQFPVHLANEGTYEMLYSQIDHGLVRKIPADVAA